MNTGSLYAPRDQPEKESERVNDWHGETKLLRWVRPLYFIFNFTFIPQLVYRGKWKMQGHTESAKTLQQFCPYRNQDFFCIPFLQMMLCTVSSGLGGLWTFYDPLLINAAQPKNLFSLNVFFLCISNLCQPQKMPTRVTFHRVKVQWVTRKNQLAQKSDVVNFKATLVFLTFQLC